MATWISNGTDTNVQALHDNPATAHGDIITLPSGTFVWSTGVNATKALTFQGNTTVNSATGVCDDQTVIVDNVPRSNGRIFACHNTHATLVARITGITFTGAGGSTSPNFNGMITFDGGGINNRIDHCHITGAPHQLNYLGVYGAISGPTYGLADHVVMDGAGTTQTGQQQIKNGTANYGDAEWTQTMGFGGPNFFFFEDCYLDNSAGMLNVPCGVDSGAGGKYVVRYCKLFNVELLNHGTDSSGRTRGGRGYELYNNEFHWSYLTTMDGIRSGTMIAHDNTFLGVKPTGWGLQSFRVFYSFDPWGGGTGDNPWDLNNDSDAVFESGTTTGGDGQSLTDTTKSWATNQWVGYVFKRLSDGQIGKVVSNTTNTAQFYIAGFSYGWTAGQAYEIHLVPTALLDQISRGQGDLIVGDDPLNDTTGTPAWPNQIIEPCYSWNNIYVPNGTSVNWVIGQNPPVSEGVHYFSDTAMPDYVPYDYPHPLRVEDAPEPTDSVVIAGVPVY